ncbi:MAG: metallophosphoesterase [Agathobacter sp.]|nr:metallophosphoesterase [Agathobacter sp.]MBQ3558047.1 metallophosphoesterase [Agathobacter sp.]
MKILFMSDEESKEYWDFFRREAFEGIDLIVSCGDLEAEYLSFLTTMTSIPVLYVKGNHDYKYDTRPPEGCICIEDDVFEFEGVRFVGLGGSYRYKEGGNQFTEDEMRKRVRRLWFKLLRKKGFDVLVTHAPAYGVNDGEDLPHRGFEAFGELIQKYNPKYFVHGHVHMNYGRQYPREDVLGETKVINAYNHYIVEL